MRCLYCDKDINKYTFTSLFIEDDKLCPDCRKQLVIKHRYKQIEGIKIESFFEYEGMYKSLLLQYKECYDEALKDVFLYNIKEYINIKYFGYEIVFVPSSEKKLNERGFNHLQLMFEDISLKRLNGLRMKEDLIQENKNLNERKLMRNNYIYEGENKKMVLVVDDVVTTGSSILGVYEALRPKVRRIKLLGLSAFLLK